jgi:hypothetical protein
MSMASLPSRRNLAWEQPRQWEAFPRSVKRTHYGNALLYAAMTRDVGDVCPLPMELDFATQIAYVLINN